MKPISIVVFVVALAFATGGEAAKLYKWIDENGNVTYSATPPPNQAAEKKEINVGRTAVSADAGPRAPVVLYVAPKCASCDMARAYLDKRKVPYTLKNAESDPAVQEELKSKSGGMSVPTITVGDKVMRGYLESLLEGELDAAGYPKVGATTGPSEGAEGSESPENGDTAEPERKFQAPEE